jgi:hypothetical protein
MSTWSKARETFGEGVPQTGERFDQSGPLRQMQTTVESAAPGSRWSGTASSAYGTANTDHGNVIGQVAGLDQRLGAQVTQTANIVQTGRQNLDAVRQWVQDAAASVPAGRNREQLLLPIVQKGLGQVQDVITTSNGQLNAVAGAVKKLGSEYQALGNQKFGPKQGPDLQGVKGDEDKKSPSEQGAADSDALQNGKLTPEQQERLANNTHLTPEQQTALDQGKLVVPPERMSYLQGFSREFGDKTPAEIKAIMDKSGADGGRVADAFQLASNPNITTGLPQTQPPSIDHPSSGGKYALPDGIQKVLDGPAMTQPMSSGVFQDGRWVVPPEPTGPLQPSQGLNDLANIVQEGDRSLQHGTALDSGLMAKSQELLDISNRHSQLGPTDDAPRWYHENVDPTMQNMFNAVNKDDMVIHDAVTGPGSEHFLNDLTNHQWQDDGRAAGGLFEWVGEDAAHDPTGRAAQTAHALAEYTSSHHSDLLNLESTRGYGAEGQSLGQVNPELTRDWARAFSPYFDDMVGNNTGGNDGLFAPLDPADGTTTEPTNTRNLMGVLMSDHPPLNQDLGSSAPKTASEILFDSTQQHVHEAFENAALSAVPGGPVTDDFAMQSAGRLQAALNLGSYDEAASRLHNTFQAQHESWQLQGKLYDLGAGAVDQFGAPGTAASDIAAFGKDFVIGPEPVEGKAPNVTIPGTFPTERFMAEVLARNGAGDMSALNGIYRDGVLQAPPDQIGAGEYRDYHNAIKKYLDSVGEPGATNDLMQTYWNTYASSVFGST